MLGAATLLRGRRLPFDRNSLPLYLVIALIGTVLPGISAYTAAIHLPAGVLSILLSSVPMFAFPIALAMDNDRFQGRRLAGLCLGMFGVALLILPEASLPDRAMVGWIPVALISSLFYALEGNYVARWGTRGLDPVQVLAGASAIGAAICLPLALATGQFIDPRLPWGTPDKALLASSLLHAAAYTGYVWLVGLAGAVFAVQVSYLVTLFGVSWAMIFLEEVYTSWIWASLTIMLAGMALVQPRMRAALASRSADRQNAPG